MTKKNISKRYDIGSKEESSQTQLITLEATKRYVEEEGLRNLMVLHHTHDDNTPRTRIHLSGDSKLELLNSTSLMAQTLTRVTLEFIKQHLEELTYFKNRGLLDILLDDVQEIEYLLERNNEHPSYQFALDLSASNTKALEEEQSKALKEEQLLEELFRNIEKIEDENRGEN